MVLFYSFISLNIRFISSGLKYNKFLNGKTIFPGNLAVGRCLEVRFKNKEYVPYTELLARLTRILFIWNVQIMNLFKNMFDNFRFHFILILKIKEVEIPKICVKKKTQNYVMLFSGHYPSKSGKEDEKRDQILQFVFRADRLEPYLYLGCSGVKSVPLSDTVIPFQTSA